MSDSASPGLLFHCEFLSRPLFSEYYDSLEKPGPCHTCFPKWSKLQEHYKRHHGREWNCPDCGARYPGPKGIKTLDGVEKFLQGHENCNQPPGPTVPIIMSEVQFDCFTTLKFKGKNVPDAEKIKLMNKALFPNDYVLALEPRLDNSDSSQDNVQEPTSSAAAEDAPTLTQNNDHVHVDHRPRALSSNDLGNPRPRWNPLPAYNIMPLTDLGPEHTTPIPPMPISQAAQIRDSGYEGSNSHLHTWRQNATVDPLEDRDGFVAQERDALEDEPLLLNDSKTLEETSMQFCDIEERDRPRFTKKARLDDYVHEPIDRSRQDEVAHTLLAGSLQPAAANYPLNITEDVNETRNETSDNEDFFSSLSLSDSEAAQPGQS